MKKTCFVLLCALLLGLAPTTFAADRAVLSLDGLLTQLLVFFVGSADELGQGEGGDSTSGELPPNSNFATGDEPERGDEVPVGG